MKVCSIEGCGKRHDSKGYCKIHYDRYKRHGDPLGGRTYEGEPFKWLLEHLDYKGDDCLIWPYAKDDFGYGCIRIDGKTERVHIVVATIKHGPRPTDKHEARHLCGRGHKGCCSPNHLIWSTQSENQMDRIMHSTSNRGERNGLSKLTRDDVLAILNDTRTQQSIATDYNVVKETISRIKSGYSWNWLTGIKP